MMYCSENCRNQAYNLYHRLECQIMRLFFEESDLPGTKFRVVRQLLIGTDQGFKLTKLMKKMTVEDIMKTDFPPSEIFKDEYETALRLHESYDRRQVKEFVPFVAQMIETLEHVGFFEASDRSLPADPEHQEGTMTKAQIFTAFLLLNHIVGMNKYFFKIKVEMREHMAKPVENADRIFKIADGFCTFFPVFNHSFEPNVFVVPRNWEAAFVTRRPIAKGEEITVSYAPVEDLHFSCQCDVCISHLYKPENLRAKPQFHSHIIPELARFQLRILLVPASDVEKFSSLQPDKIVGIVLLVCKWLCTNIKYPNEVHFKIQKLVSFYIRLFYAMLNEFIPRKISIANRYVVLREIMDALDINLESALV